MPAVLVCNRASADGTRSKAAFSAFIYRRGKSPAEGALDVVQSPNRLCDFFVERAGIRADGTSFAYPVDEVCLSTRRQLFLTG